MNEDVFDGTEAENLDLSGSGEDTEDYGIGEDYYGEASEAAFPTAYNTNLARARAQARARALARARRYPSVPSSNRQRVNYMPPTSSGPASTVHVRQGFGRVSADIQRTQAALRSVNIENKVQADVFGRVLKAQQQRIRGNESALAVSKVVDEFKAQFPDIFANPIIDSGLRQVSLFFLRPDKRGSGFESFISDPRFWGPALAAAIAIYKEITRERRGSTSPTA